MSHPKDKITVISIYETGCGGETIAHEHFLNQLRNRTAYSVKTLELTPLQNTDLCSYFLWFFKSFFKSLNHILKFRSGIIYTPTFTAGIATIAVRMFKDNKLIFHYHGNRIPHKQTGVDILQQLKYYFSFYLHEILFSFSDLNIFPSEYSCSQIGKIFPNSIRKSIVINNGVDTSKFFQLTSKEIDSYKNNLKIQRSAKVLLFVGRLNKYKNISRVIYLFYLFNNRNPKSILLIAHPTPSSEDERIHKSEIGKVIGKFGITSSVIFLENQDLPMIYNVSDLCLLLSLRENFPLVMLESLSCGTPFVSSHPSTKKILTKIQPKWYLKTQDLKLQYKAIEQILSSNKAQQKHISQKTAKAYDWHYQGKKINQSIQQLLH